MNTMTNDDALKAADATELAGDNATYIESLYEQYLQDPDSVDADWKAYFKEYETGNDALHHAIQDQFLLLARNQSLGLKIGPIFRKADKEATMRPVDGIAAMGINANNKTIGNEEKAGVVSPKYMMIAPVKPVNYVITPGIDFRNEFALTPEEKAKGIT